MTKSILVLALFSLFLLMPACKSNESTTPPTPPATTASIIVESSSDMLHIGDSDVFTATVTMSNGTTQAVTGGTWSASDMSVATVGATTGEVTILGSGYVTVFLDYQGARGSKKIRGLPDYRGTWKGNYYVESCTCSGSLKNRKFCNNFPAHKVFPCGLNLTQDEDRVDGRFYLGTLGADVNGPVDIDGKLLLTGTVKEGSDTIEVMWTLQSTMPGRITGELGQHWREMGQMGHMMGDGRISCKIRDLDRSSTITTSMAPAGPLLWNPRLEDLILALTGR